MLLKLRMGSEALQIDLKKRRELGNAAWRQGYVTIRNTTFAVSGVDKQHADFVKGGIAAINKLTGELKVLLAAVGALLERAGASEALVGLAGIMEDIAKGLDAAKAAMASGKTEDWNKFFGKSKIGNWANQTPVEAAESLRSWARRGLGLSPQGGIKIPGLASGGVVTKPTLAMIGESGPEMRVPLRSGQAADRDPMTSGSVLKADIGGFRPKRFTAEDVDSAARIAEREGRPFEGTTRDMEAYFLTHHIGSKFDTSTFRRSTMVEPHPVYGPERDVADLSGSALAKQAGDPGKFVDESNAAYQADLLKRIPDAKFNPRTGEPLKAEGGSSGATPNFGGGFGGGSTESTPTKPDWATVTDAQRAAGVRPDLQAVIKQAQHDNPDLNFAVGPGGGTRTQAQQDANVRRGVSWTRDSFHIGGNAIDLVPIIDGKLRWGDPKNGDTPAQIAAVKESLKKIDTAVYTAATKLGVVMGSEAMDPKFHAKDPGHYSIPPAKEVPVQRFPPGPPPDDKVAAGGGAARTSMIGGGEGSAALRGSGAGDSLAGGYGGGQTSAAEPYNPSVANIDPNALGFVRAIGRTETDFSEREAYSDATNIKSYGSKTSEYDYGYYQMAQRDIDYAVKTLHMSPDVAQHLNGGPDHKSTYEQQTAAVDEYLKRRYPEQYKNLVEHGDYEGMRQATRRGKSWLYFGLRDKPQEALTEYKRTASTETPLPKSRPAGATAQASAQDHKPISGACRTAQTRRAPAGVQPQRVGEQASRCSALNA